MCVESKDANPRWINTCKRIPTFVINPEPFGQLVDLLDHVLLILGFLEAFDYDLQLAIPMFAAYWMVRVRRSSRSG